jgi:uncharacterized protein
MSTRIERESTITSAKDIAQRMKTIEWERVSQDLDAQGSAIVKCLITPAECNGLAQLYLEDGNFRSRVVMAQHGFGRGEYKYFSYPLPDIIAGLRTAVYPHLAPIANRHRRSLPGETRGLHRSLP